MAAKKKTTIKSENDGKGTKAQVDAFKKTKSSVGATAAFTNKGQKATGLRSLTPAEVAARKANESKPRTPIKNAKSGFAGSGTPLGASFGVSKITKGDVAKAVLAAAGGKAAPTVVKAVSRAAESTRLAIGTEKMIRQMSRESGIPMPKISSRINNSASQSKMAKRIVPEELKRLASKKKNK